MTNSPVRDRIEFNPKILAGKAIVKGTRISVEFLLELLANGWSHETILDNYPQLSQEDIFAALDYARLLVKEEHVFPIKVRTSSTNLYLKLVYYYFFSILF